MQRGHRDDTPHTRSQGSMVLPLNDTVVDSFIPQSKDGTESARALSPATEAALFLALL